MQRAFGIDADVPASTTGALAALAERLGYGSFWVNGSPPSSALRGLAEAAAACSLQLGVGVLPLTGISPEDIVGGVRSRGIPAERLWLGVGSNRKPGALAEVRDAAMTIRSKLSSRLVTGAVGPRMTQLAGEIADCVLFTWWPRGEVGASRQLVAESAADSLRPTPVIASYVRCALLPQASEAVAENTELYGKIPRYARVFARNGLEPADMVMTGRDRAELAPLITREEVVIDLPIIRAITPDHSFDAIAELAEACAP